MPHARRPFRLERWIAVAGIALYAICSSQSRAADADQTPATVATPAPPPPVVVHEPPPDEAVVLTDLDVRGGTLEDLIAFLQKNDPNFKAVVYRDAGVPAHTPAVSLKVKGASRRQILDLLQLRNQNLQITKLEGGPAPIHAFHVTRPQSAQAVDAPPYVRVYPLAAAVQRIVETRPDDGGKAPTQKDALDRVLSLIKAAASAQESPDGPASLQVHAETQVLIVTGTTPQQRIIDDVLSALTRRPTGERELESAKEAVDAAREQGKRREMELMDAIERLKKSEEMHTQDILDKTQQIERLKVRLEDLERRTDQKQKP